MARARNIKPSIFKNEILGTADPLLTLLFESLWCLADKAGRLEDRPLRIKAETFPYREGIDINGYLTELERMGFIERYEVGNLKVIQVVNFEKHQNPHHTEKDSELPEKPTTCQATGNSPSFNREPTQAERSDSLIPDSLNTDSLHTAQPPKTAEPVAVDPKSSPEKPTKLPADFELTDDLKAYAAKNYPSGDVQEIFDDFCDFWWNIATKNNKRTARGWVSTWQRRIRQLRDNAKAKTKTVPMPIPVLTQRNDFRNIELPPMTFGGTIDNMPDKRERGN